MPLETGTYINDLDSSNPAATDLKSQGDDHLRLIKDVLRNTFPNADKSFRFPVVSEKTTNYTVVASDHNGVIDCDTTAGTLYVYLPAGATLFDGFAITIVKSDATSTGVIVDANGSETINGAATYTLNTQYQSVGLVWSTTAGGWYATSNSNISEAGGIVTADLADDAVTTAKIIDAAITYAKLASGAVASATEYIAATASKLLNAANTWEAAEPVELTYAASIAPDLATGLNFYVTLTGNATLAAMTNQKVGQSGFIRVIQDGTGSRTLDVSAYYTSGSHDLTLSTAADAEDLLFYVVYASGRVHLSIAENLGQP